MMLEELALVTRSDGRQVYVKSLQSSACTHCLQQQSCGTSFYAKLLPNREMALISPIPLQIGDRVIVGIAESHLLRASLLMYLVPLIIMLTTAVLVEGGESIVALLTFAGLSTGFYLVHRIQQGFLHALIAPPQIIRKL